MMIRFLEMFSYNYKCLYLDRFLGTVTRILHPETRYDSWVTKYNWEEKAWDNWKILTQVVHSWTSYRGRFLSSLWRTAWKWDQWNTKREHGQIHSLKAHVTLKEWLNKRLWGNNSELAITTQSSMGAKLRGKRDQQTARVPVVECHAAWRQFIIQVLEKSPFIFMISSYLISKQPSLRAISCSKWSPISVM